jgi:hypothetical protein
MPKSLDFLHFFTIFKSRKKAKLNYEHILIYINLKSQKKLRVMGHLNLDSDWFKFRPMKIELKVLNFEKKRRTNFESFG